MRWLYAPMEKPWCVFVLDKFLGVRRALSRSSLLWSLGWKVGLPTGATSEAQLMCKGRCRRDSKPQAESPLRGRVAGQGVGEGSRLPSFFSCSSGMQALVLLLWTGALLGYGSSQNVASGSEVSRVGRCGQQLF